MKAEILKKIIREIVRSEVKKVLQTEIRQQLSEIILGNPSKKTLQAPDIRKEINRIADPEPVMEQVTEPKKRVRYTKNEALNDILNETTGGVPREGSMSSMASMVGFEEEPTLLTESDVPDNAPKEVKGVVSAMNRDYGDLMKAMDKRKAKK